LFDRSREVTRLAPARHSVEGVLMTLSLDTAPADRPSGGEPRIYAALLREMPITPYDPSWVEFPADNWPTLDEDWTTAG
jgi:hypothetical protein